MNPDSCDDIPNPCPKKRSDTVDRAFHTAAKAWLPRARKAMADYVKSPSNKRSQRAADALKKHFGLTEAVKQQDPFARNIPPHIIDVIDRLMRDIDKPHGAICMSSSVVEDPISKDRKLIYAFVSPPFFGTNCFSFTPTFFKKAEEDKTFAPRVVIHEMLHSHEGMGLAQETYFGGTGYPGSIRQADNNPDSFAALIRDLGTKD